MFYFACDSCAYNKVTIMLMVFKKSRRWSHRSMWWGYFISRQDKTQNKKSFIKLFRVSYCVNLYNHNRGGRYMPTNFVIFYSRNFFFPPKLCYRHSLSQTDTEILVYIIIVWLTIFYCIFCFKKINKIFNIWIESFLN